MSSLSLRVKFMIGVGGVLLLLVLASLLYIRHEMRNYLEHELHKRGTSIARHLAESAITPILTENGIKLQLLVNDYRSKEEDIHYIYIVNTRGEPVAHTFGARFPSDLLRLTAQIPLSGEPRPVQTEQGLLAHVVAPIQEGKIGYVHLGVSTAVIDNDLRSMELQALPFVVTFLLLGVLAALLVAVSITRPIGALAHGARMVGKGNLNWKIDIHSRDEIGELASTFNWMTEELQRKIAEQQRVESELHLQTQMLEAEAGRRQVAQEALAVKQQQLEALNQSLEDRVKETLAALREKDQLLIEQGRFAAMGEMISNIAHQWRQPLNNVALIIQNIQSSHRSHELTEEVMAREVGTAMDVICFMSQTIDDFRLFFCKNKVKAPFSINHAVSRAVEFMSAALKNNGINLVLDEEQELQGLGYANEFSQVLLNIIVNAKDVLLEQQVSDPWIRIRICQADGRPRVIVRDNGGGIPDEILPRVFDPYFTTKDMTRGTGIGLYMSRIIIEHSMGGRLVATNTPEGAEFRIEL